VRIGADQARDRLDPECDPGESLQDAVMDIAREAQPFVSRGLAWRTISGIPMRGSGRFPARRCFGRESVRYERQRQAPRRTRGKSDPHGPSLGDV
jgi:hypothetical protein